jgi:hypothetical protein
MKIVATARECCTAVAIHHDGNDRLCQPNLSQTTMQNIQHIPDADVALLLVGLRRSGACTL